MYNNKVYRKTTKLSNSDVLKWEIDCFYNDKRTQRISHFTQKSGTTHRLFPTKIIEFIQI